MNWLKADFHSHSADDPRDEIAYSAESLIEQAANAGIQILAITCHERLVYDPYLAEYARRRGLLLIPGIESHINGRHLLILNPDPEQASARTFDELRALGPRNAALIAPHPFFPGGCSLMDALVPNIDLFHAIEFSSFYFLGINFNRKAVDVARKHRLPLVGNSDTHVLPYCDSTCTWIQAKPEVDDVIAAIREGRVRLETRPRPMSAVADMFRFSLAQAWRDRRKQKHAQGSLA
jgi:predicted metal-dependent phosphoesterase TrpH